METSTVCNILQQPTRLQEVQICFVKSCLKCISHLLRLIQYNPVSDNSQNVIIIAHLLLPEPQHNLFINSLYQVDCSPSLSIYKWGRLKEILPIQLNCRAQVHHNVKGSIKLIKHKCTLQQLKSRLNWCIYFSIALDYSSNVIAMIITVLIYQYG